MRQFLLYTGVLFCILSAGAQQLPQYSQWSLHQFSLNPAHAGIKKCVDVHALARAQWYGFDGAPQSGFITASIPLRSRRNKFLSARHGTGIKFERDQIGQFLTHRLNVAYAAHFNFTVDNRLSLGIYGGFVQFSYNHANSVTIDPDPTVQNEANFIAPDASFGAWWNGKNYYFGLILQNLIPYKWPAPGTDSRFRFHTTLNGGYRYRASENVSLLPGFIARIPPAGPPSIDLNVMADFKNQVAFGLGYRNTDALIVFASFKFKGQFSINYSFDYVLSSLRPGTINTHEFSLIYSGCKRPSSSTYSCPLFE